MQTYENFNAIGKKVYKRLQELGATPVVELGLGDDDANLEEDFKKWKKMMWPAVTAALGKGSSSDPEALAEEGRYKVFLYFLRVIFPLLFFVFISFHGHAAALHAQDPPRPQGGLVGESARSLHPSAAAAAVPSPRTGGQIHVRHKDPVHRHDPGQRGAPHFSVGPQLPPRGAQDRPRGSSFVGVRARRPPRRLSAELAGAGRPHHEAPRGHQSPASIFSLFTHTQHTHTLSLSIFLPSVRVLWRVDIFAGNLAGADR